MLSTRRRLLVVVESCTQQSTTLKPLASTLALMHLPFKPTTSVFLKLLQSFYKWLQIAFFGNDSLTLFVTNSIVLGTAVTNLRFGPMYHQASSLRKKSLAGSGSNSMENNLHPCITGSSGAIVLLFIHTAVNNKTSMKLLARQHFNLQPHQGLYPA